MEPQPRDLRLASPRCTAPTWPRCSACSASRADGEFGPVTADAVAAWKRVRGDFVAPSPELTPGRAPSSARGRPAPGGAADGALGGGGGRRGAARLEPRARAGRARGAARRHAAARRRWGTPGARSRCSWRHSPRAAGRRRSACGGAAFNALYTPAMLAEAKAGAFGLRVVAGRPRAAAISFCSTGISRGGDPADHVGGSSGRPLDGRVRTVDGNSGDDGSGCVRDRSIGSVRAFARDS